MDLHTLVLLAVGFVAGVLLWEISVAIPLRDELIGAYRRLERVTRQCDDLRGLQKQILEGGANDDGELLRFPASRRAGVLS